jgi:predicted DNA-binding protein (MmcQ/YjbR family)
MTDETPILPHASAFAAMRAAALALPDAYEEFPWGESAFKVRAKTFVFTRNDATGLHLSVKLPASREFALEYSFTKPTGYGLGKAGWVSASFGPGDAPPLDILEAWIAESYRAVAPKKRKAAKTKD